MSGEEFKESRFVLLSAIISIEKHKKKRLPTLSVSIRSLKKFTVKIITRITPVVMAIVL
jgi:hypothetical protein